MCEANLRKRKKDGSDYFKKQGIGEKTVKITGPKNLIVMIQIAFKLIIIQFLSLHISTSYYTNIKKLKANFKTYPGLTLAASFGHSSWSVKFEIMYFYAPSLIIFCEMALIVERGNRLMVSLGDPAMTFLLFYSAYKTLMKSCTYTSPEAFMFLYSL